MERPLPSGILHINGTGTLEPNAGREAVAQHTEKINTIAYLENAFYNPDNPRVLLTHKFPDNSAVSIIDQTSKYADITLMVIAKGPAAQQNPSDHQPTETIYHYPQHTQELYWKSIFTSMQVLQETSSSNTRVIATENCVAQYSNEKHRTSRTVSHPHSHVLAIVEEHIEPSSHTTQHLEKERQVASQYMPTLLTNIQEHMPQSAKEVTLFSLRQEFPHGYTMTIPATLSELTQNVSQVRTLLSAHHEAYTKATATKENVIFSAVPQELKEQTIPQPSYRLYLEHIRDQLYISVSPEFLSPSGAMEAAGITLHRSEENPKRFPDGFLQEVQNKAVAHIKKFQKSE